MIVCVREKKKRKRRKTTAVLAELTFEHIAVESGSLRAHHVRDLLQETGGSGTVLHLCLDYTFQLLSEDPRIHHHLDPLSPLHFSHILREILLFNVIACLINSLVCGMEESLLNVEPSSTFIVARKKKDLVFYETYRVDVGGSHLAFFILRQTVHHPVRVWLA